MFLFYKEILIYFEFVSLISCNSRFCGCQWTNTFSHSLEFQFHVLMFIITYPNITDPFIHGFWFQRCCIGLFPIHVVQHFPKLQNSIKSKSQNILKKKIVLIISKIHMFLSTKIFCFNPYLLEFTLLKTTFSLRWKNFALPLAKKSEACTFRKPN